MEKDWIEELSVKPGDHIIAILTEEDDLDLLPPYVADGLSKENVCSVIALPNVADQVRARLEDAGIDVDREEIGRHIVVHDPRKLGEESGRFTVEVFVKRLQDFIQESKKSGISHIRNMSQMSWVTEITGEADGIHLCARLNDVFKDEPISGF